jgi:hypothetical protein
MTQPQEGTNVNRILTRTAVLLTVAGMACLPVAAVADSQPVSFDNTTTSIVSGDVFGAGHSNIVGSGDGAQPGGGSGGLGATAPNGERSVRIETRTDGVRLVDHTGDARFPEYLPAFWTAIVGYSGDSTAVYQGSDSGYRLSLPANSYQVSCVATTGRGRCEVNFQGGEPVITLG